MTSTATVTVHYAQAIVQAAERLALPLPEQVRAVAAEGRISLAHQDALWEAFCGAAQDPLIGLRLGGALQVGHLDMVGALLMSCETLGEALEALLEYYPIVGEGGEFTLSVEGQSLRLSYVPHFQVRQTERCHAVLACLLQLTRWISGGRCSAQLLSFPALEQSLHDRYQALLDCPLAFVGGGYSLLFAQADLNVPLIQANALMREHLRALADSQLQRLSSQSLAMQVRELLRAQPRWGKERIAEQLQLSGRHLNRKLAEEGASFKVLRDQVLFQMAEHCLREDAKAAEVAEALGFSDESAFVKAFRRWSGMTPGQFRQGVNV